MAVIYHGYPRTTGDLDLFYEGSPENIRSLLAALRSFFQTDFGLTEQDLLASAKIIQLGLPPNRIDLIKQINGVTFTETAQTAVEVEFEEVGTVLLIGRATLIKNKRAVGRNRDKDDLEFLEPEP
ncbi:MAG: hypothetical protein HYX74_07660 [Acidobacteria bacterium]|nr:hypothetical protein [Acidobacteriota bacterium]